MDELDAILGISPPRPARAISREHRVTDGAWQALSRLYPEHDLPTILTKALHRLAPIAHVAYRQDMVLVTNYAFGASIGKETVQYVPNEHGGITITLPGEPS